MENMLITRQTPLKRVLELGKECDRCNNCCKHDSGIFLDEDIRRIAKHLHMKEDQFNLEYLDKHQKFNKDVHKGKIIKKKGKPYGKCIFLDETGCRIHEIKPLHCRVCTTKGPFGQQLSIWFMLNYLIDPTDPESVRQYAEYLKSQPTIPGGELHEIVNDEERLNKILSYEILK